MPLTVGKILGITTAQNTQKAYATNPQGDFVKNTYNYGNANLNRPEHRGDGVHGDKLYCLA